MQHDTARNTAGLARLEELDDYEVADGFPDPRGWDVTTRDGQKVGKVKNLLVDQNAMRVRMLEVELDRKLARTDADRLVHVPVASARLDDDRDDVLVDLDAAAFSGLGAADLAATHDLTDQRYENRDFFGKRAAGRENEAYLRLHEERLDVGKRQVQDAVELRTTVETERVRETVPLRRDEVTVERRPLSADAVNAGADLEIREESIRVPLSREEAVVEKRVVPVEEVVVRTNSVTENQTVEDTVRRERLAVEGDARETRAGNPGAGTSRDANQRA